MSGNELGAVMDRIAKLLALSSSSNEHEAAAAAAKAQELMFRHNLSVAQLQAGMTGNRDHFENRAVDLGARTTWRRQLIASLARCNFCKVIVLTGGPRVGIVGEAHNIGLVEHLYAYLVREIVRLADPAWETAKDDTYETAREWKGGFYLGAVATIARRLTEQRRRDEQATGESKALVVVKDATLQDAYRRHYPEARPGRSRASGSTEGWRAGRSAGEGIALHAPIERGGCVGRLPGGEAA